MDKGGYTYILADRPFGVLYIGVTADLPARMMAHRNGTGSKFARRWGCTCLVHVERHDRIEDAITREKALKNWKRVWKLRLIAEANPNWDDLFERINR